MADPSKQPAARFRVPLVIAGTFVLLLAAAIGVRWLSQPVAVELLVSGPVGAQVRVDVTVDGRGETQLVIPPVTLRFTCHELRYAVIPVSASAGNVALEVSTPWSGGSVADKGVLGSVEHAGLSTTSVIGPMTSRHVAQMRTTIEQGDL